jgi:hypothetical protein
MEDWRLNQFHMLDQLKQHRPHRAGEVPVWIKVRIDLSTDGEHAIVDRYRASIGSAGNDFGFEKHESGPEIIVFLSVGVAGITLAKEVIGLITTIIKARSETRRKGEMPADPIKIIVRRVDDEGGITEEIILRLGQTEIGRKEVVEQRLMDTLREVAKRKK